MVKERAIGVDYIQVCQRPLTFKLIAINFNPITKAYIDSD